MKKSLFIFLITFTILLSGCQKKEDMDMFTPSETELSTEENGESPEIESVDKEEGAEKITGSTSSIEINSVVDNEKDEERSKNDIYKEQMDLICQALSEEWSIDKYFENEISSLISNHYEGNALDNIGYALKDLDGDGKEELLISAVSKEASGGMLYDVYSAPNEKVIHVLSGHERNRYYLQWQEEGVYMIANEASNSAYNSAWYYYSLDDGDLELVQGVVFNAAEDEENPWYITYDEDWDTSNDAHDIDGTAESIIDAYKNSYTSLEYIPFSEYGI